MTQRYRRPEPGDMQPPRRAGMHDLGGHRHGLDDGGRRAACAPDRQRGGRHHGFSFVQVSDSHLGFDKPVNPDVTAHLADALRR